MFCLILETKNSAGQKKCYEYCCMKLKKKMGIGITQYKDAATPLTTRGIGTTHQHFQMRYITLFQLKRLKSYQP